MPKEGEPKKPVNTIIVAGIQFKMEHGLTLEEAIKESDQEIEATKSYDSAYPQQKAALKAAAEYLRSLEKKS